MILGPDGKPARPVRPMPMPDGLIKMVAEEFVREERQRQRFMAAMEADARAASLRESLGAPPLPIRVNLPPQFGRPA